MDMGLKTIVPVSEARRNLFRIMDKIQQPDTRFVLTVDGRPRAVVLSIDEWESMLSTLDIATDPAMVKAIERGEKDIKEGKYYSLDEVLSAEGLEVVRDKAAKYKVKKIKKAQRKRTKK